MKQLKDLSILLLAGSSLSAVAIAHANSTFTVTLAQVGPDVVATGTGAIDLTGLSSFGSPLASPELYPAHGVIGIGPSGTTDLYAGTSGPASFGPGFGGFPTTTTGDSVFLGDFGLLLNVPQGYVSDTSLSGSATYSGTFATLNLTPGIYTWTWDSGANSFVLKIPAAVPDPGTLSLIALPLVGLAVLNRRRKSQTR